MFNDDFEDELSDELAERSQSLKSKLKEKARVDFIEGCYTAYGILERDGKKALEQGDLDSICRAINRMMSLFLVKEEYERCSFLQRYVEQNIPGHQIQPDPNLLKQLTDL